MKKIFAMLAAILLCGSMMVSCNKDDNTPTTPTTNNPTKADMVGTWEGSFQGNTTIENVAENYTINWVLTLNAEGSNTVGSLKYNATINGYEDLAHEVVVNDYYVRQNTDIGRICLTGNHPAGILEDMIDFDIDLSAKTLKGTLMVHTGGEDGVTIGGTTTLNKK